MWALHQLRETERRVRQERRDSATTGGTTNVIPVPTAPHDVPFDAQELAAFPALRTRNFWCIQRHQATALHYDLRLRVGDGMVSWAVPRGLLGLSPGRENSRLAVETSVHPLSYAVHEGPDRSRPGCGTLLWDVGRYSILEMKKDSESDDDEESDDNGAFEEAKLQLSLNQIEMGKRQSFHIVLYGGRKMTQHEFALVLPRARTRQFTAGGEEKREWLLQLPRRAKNVYSWGPDGEDGPQFGNSVKSGLSFQELLEVADSRLSGG